MWAQVIEGNIKLLCLTLSPRFFVGGGRLSALTGVKPPMGMRSSCPLNAYIYTMKSISVFFSTP